MLGGQPGRCWSFPPPPPPLPICLWLQPRAFFACKRPVAAAACAYSSKTFIKPMEFNEKVPPGTRFLESWIWPPGTWILEPWIWVLKPYIMVYHSSIALMSYKNLHSKPTIKTWNRNLLSKPSIIKTYNQQLQSKPTIKPKLKTYNQNLQSKPSSKTFKQNLQSKPTVKTYNQNLQ